MNERASWNWKASSGRFRVYLVGKMDWRVTNDDGPVVAQERNLSDSFTKARWFNDHTQPCLDCDEQGLYPNGNACKSCGGIGRVPKGSNDGVMAY